MTEHNDNHNHDHDHNHHDHDHHNHDHEHQQITLVDDQGNEELYEILFTFDSEDFNKSYILVYPVASAEEDEDGAVELQAYTYVQDEENDEGRLLPIETDEEWDMIEEVLNTFIEDENL